MLSFQGWILMVQMTLQMLNDKKWGDNLAVAKPLSRSLHSLYMLRS